MRGEVRIPPFLPRVSVSRTSASTVELLGSNLWRSRDGFGFAVPSLIRFHHVCSEPGYVFDKACLLSYNHMSFGGGPLEVGTEEEAEKLTSQNEMDSANGNDYTTLQLPVHV